MPLNFAKELAALQRMTVKALRVKYAEVFGDQTLATSRALLIKRIAWRIQALAEGDLSQRARQRAAELANDADLRLLPPKADPATSEPRTTERLRRFEPDHRLPPPGTVITRKYKGETLQVKVLHQGFEYADQVYASLSAVAKAVTGSHCNGFLFFQLGQPGGAV